MLRTAISAMLTLFLLLPLGSVHSQAHASLKPIQAGKIRGGLKDPLEHAIPNWFKESFLDIRDDVDQANADKKHVMLFFYLNDCPYCFKMLKDSFSGEAAQAFIQNDFDVIAINTRGDREVVFNQELTLTEKELTQKLKVQYTPAILFLDDKNQIVVRLNGYRSAAKFKSILNYVSTRAYHVLELSEYLAQHKQPTPSYSFKKHPLFQSRVDFSSIKTPLAIVFEDRSCGGCEHLYDNVLTNSGVIKELKKFTIVRLDANSEQEIIDINGVKTNPKQWAKKAAINYRPGIILYDQGKEITRIDGMLYSFHFKEVFRYVSSQSYLQHQTYLEYLAKRQTELLKQGVNINITN